MATPVRKFRLSDRTWDTLGEIARLEGTTRSEIIVGLIDGYIASRVVTQLPEADAS